MKEKRKLRFILYVFAFLLIVGVVGYMSLLKVSFTDALYTTVITISTVSFGEIGATGSWSELFSIIVIFLGVGTAGYAFTMVIVMFVGGRVRDFWKGGKMEEKVASLNGYYIIHDSGELAEVIIDKFIDQSLNFAVTTNKREDLDDYSHNDILVVEGMPIEEEVLEHAGIDRAKGLVSTLGSEVDNIVTVLTAKNLNKSIHMIANAIIKPGSEKLMKVGVSKALSAIEISGRRVVSLMIKPNIISFLDMVTRIGDVELDLEEAIAKSESCLENKNLIETQIPNKTGLIIFAIKVIEDNKMIFNSPVNHTFQIGDVLIVLGRENQADKLKHLGDETE